VGRRIAPPVKVARYGLDLDLEYPNGAFRGTCTVAGSGLRGQIELDCEDLDVTEAHLDGVAVPFSVERARNKLVVSLGESDGQQLHVRFSGQASAENLTGLYVSASGERPVLTTMLAPAACRRLLPCFDTPDQKAVFAVTVTTDPDVAVISNGDLVRREPAGARARWVFAPTPPMATYLLYLGVGPFETEERSADGVRVVSAALPGKVRRARTLLDLAGPLVRAYGDYYGQAYPLPKLHLVAVPDLWAGAMENWGAITFPEAGLLVDDDTTPVIRRWAFETLAHEIAHQWFGNLVTMETFDDLWLNESFATFVAARMEDRLGMRSNASDELLVRCRSAYFGDSLAGTHPIRLDLHDAKAIAENTDEITYFKGALVLRMIDAYLGPEEFRRGVARYLERFRYGNARGEDLWTALGSVEGEPVADVLRPWVERPGLPVLHVQARDGALRLEQSRFQFTGSRTGDPPWPIPLTILVGGRTHRLLVRGSSAEVPFAGGEELRVNPGRAAFVRVRYDPALRRAVLRKLRSWESADRWAVLDDTKAFLLSGDATLEEYLELVREGRAFSDYPSVVELASSLAFLAPFLEGAPAFRTEALGFYRAQFARLTAEVRPGEPDTDGAVREEVAAYLARWDDDFARSLAGRFAEVDRLPAALRPAVTLSFARTEGEAAFEPLEARVRSTSDEVAALSAGEALGALRSEALLSRALGLVLDRHLRATATHEILASMVQEPIGRPLVWKWLTENLRELERRTRGSWSLARLLERVVPLAGLGRPAEVEQYFARERFPEAESGIRKALEVLRLGIALAERCAATGSRSPATVS
jgi:tricorn protease interacting factor F2/3